MRSRMSDRTGAAIRKLRLARGWNLATLSAESGVPISTISRVELGQNALNYEKLMRLCRALQVDLEGLVTREAEASHGGAGRRAVLRAGDGLPTRIGGNTGRRAASELKAKNFSPIVVDVTASSLGAHGPLTSHDGEAYVLVLDGELEFHSRLYAPLRLSTGDAVYFDAGSGYALVAPGRPARALVVAAGESDFGP